MKAALHFVAGVKAPQGIWWEVPGGVRSSYVENSPIEALGRYTVYRKVDEVPYAAYFDQLADCTPVSDDWEVVDLSPWLKPEDFLHMVRRMATNGS